MGRAGAAASTVVGGRPEAPMIPQDPGPDEERTRTLGRDKPKPRQKRFYTTATVARAQTGWTVRLDTRTLRTPARGELLLPTETLAQAIADEWSAQDTHIDVIAMPLTRLANVIIDHVAGAAEPVREEIARYAQTDLICYRAEGPDDLVALQAAHWDPLLRYARDQLGAALHTATGVGYVAQDAGALRALRAPLSRLDPWQLTALQQLVSISGSLVIGLALMNGQLTTQDAWAAAELDDQYQISKWGDDPLALDARSGRWRDFAAAAKLLELTRPG